MAGQASDPVTWQDLTIVVGIMTVVVIPLLIYIWTEHHRRVGALEKKSAGVALSTELDQIREEFTELERVRRAEQREDARLSEERHAAAMQRIEERHTAAMQRMEDKHQNDFQGLRKDINGMAETIRREMAEQARANREDVVARVEAMGTSFASQMSILIKLLEQGNAS